MTSRGERAIEQAKEEGSWSILDDASALIVSDDLAQAMEQAGVRAEYDKLAPSKQRSMLEGIALAKTNKTREARINRIVRECQVSGG
nr:YdeI/OmpD-associated family protein [Allopontixanthobacter confluentis]